ncbi:unnamed protein product, partial [Ectocarpus sp. 12 AP-2014]
LVIVYAVGSRPLNSNASIAGTEHVGFSPDQAFTSPSGKHREVFGECHGIGFSPETRHTTKHTHRQEAGFPPLTHYPPDFGGVLCLAVCGPGVLKVVDVK